MQPTVPGFQNPFAGATIQTGPDTVWYRFVHTFDLHAIGNVLYIILSVVTIFFIFMISYSAVRMFEIRKKEREHLEHELAEYAHHQAERAAAASEGSTHNPRWEQVLAYLHSANSSDWKLAIIEADSMLDDLMDTLGFKGENLGDKLTGADRDKFPDLTAAWEAHTVRNKIAHEGSAFSLSEHEARRLVSAYQDMFRRFGYI